MAHNAADAPGGTGFDQAVKHGLLQLALEGAATHDPQLNVQRVALHLADEGRNQAVVAKFVDEAAIQGDVVRVVEQALHLGGGIAASGQVELVGLVDELGDALRVRGVKGTKFAHMSRLFR